ncbi:hypothetical protein EW026_g1603 [Hermanssonia centrifuga]|uniref:DUF6535 domain-containing protein n=1 Tax=Hermanssonia centrifuga TaxID=98765 RepID=A0A4S4KSQ7_9APHY|nr:hypothetical protein EW026_g1603 [Hermanssonia centrifuga]
MEKRDDGLVLGWKDEMNNLLIFAGLFSAVVTAFAIVSYQLLQQDPASSAVQILSNISQQLSSLTINGAFINSTVGAASPQPASDSIPLSLIIQVNTLWFLSLALSLVAALFAIVVQQWLREYPVSGLRSVRECLRLRHFRYQNLNAWGVPHIVSILPILLQIALMLFLVGLAMLLWSLNRTIALPFIIFLCVTLGFFLFTTIMPALSPSCPYKSPLAELILLTVRSCVHISSLLIKSVVISLLTAAILATTLLIGLQHCWSLASPWLDYVRQGLLNKATRILVPNSWPFTPSKRANLLFSEYWASCDVDIVGDTPGLDQSILIWAPSALPSNHWSQIYPCLQDCTPDEVIQCVSQLITQNLNISGHSSETESPHNLRYPARDSLRHMERRSIEQCREYLFNALLQYYNDALNLPDKLFADELQIDAYLVLYLLMCAQPRPSSAVRNAYIKMLYGARKRLSALGRKDNMANHSRLRIITSALLECSTEWDYGFTLNETRTIAKWVSDVWSLVPLEPTQFWIDQACLEELLGTIALALFAMCQHASLLDQSRDARDCCLDLLHCLNMFASTNEARFKTLVEESPDVTFANDGFMASACSRICLSLSILAPALRNELLTLGVVTAERLSDLFRGWPRFEESERHLDSFLDTVKEKSGALRAVPTRETASRTRT